MGEYFFSNFQTTKLPILLKGSFPLPRALLEVNTFHLTNYFHFLNIPYIYFFSSPSQHHPASLTPSLLPLFSSQTGKRRINETPFLQPLIFDLCLSFFHSLFLLASITHSFLPLLHKQDRDKLPHSFNPTHISSSYHSPIYSFS